MTESQGLKDKAGGRGGRWRPYAGTVVVLTVVFGGSALIGAHVRGTKANNVRVPTGAASPDQFALPVRPSVPVTLTVYEDLRSPTSKAFAAEYSATFDQLLKSGQVQINYRLVTPTDNGSGGSGSMQAANAAACAQDQGRFTEYVDQLWGAQPANPQDDVFAGKKLLTSLANKAQKINAANFVPCVQGDDHEGWVKKSQEAFADAGFSEVPVVQVNGETVASGAAAKDTLTPARLSILVKQAAAKATGASPSATATSSPASSPFATAG
jgi:predicted DsbA family dithiol-disulfide isomerase